MEKITVVHVDDDPKQLEAVKAILKDMPAVSSVTGFNNAKEARDYILENEVDLAILDVEMPGNNGLWLADQIKGSDTAILFLTSYPQYSLQAFEACALHYIIKPATPELMMEALERFNRMRPYSTANSGIQQEQVNELLNNYLSKLTYPKRIFINNVHRTKVLNLDDVMYISSVGGPYCIFKCTDGNKYTASKILKVYAKILEGHPDFVRIHRAHIVNKKFAKAILRNKHAINLEMADGEELEISPQKREEIYQMLLL
ncbi:MAG: response regulator transcription factor [Bacteroidetes bacterium]|nr:response regulator transcription factor [Bacteroidota bacterium]